MRKSSLYVQKAGRASICHCRMCQKAFGGFFGPLLSTEGLIWTRGERSIFHSSNRNWRGFCKDCGTPLTYEFEGGLEVSIGSLDKPELFAPTVQVNGHLALKIMDGLGELPHVDSAETAQNNEYNEKIVSNQHPDNDT